MRFTFSKKKLMTGILIFIISVFIINLFWFRPFFIKHFFYLELIDGLKNDPQTATKVKVAYLYGKYKDRLNDQSISSIQIQDSLLKRSYARLQRYDDDHLNPTNRLSKEIISWHLETDIERIPFRYHKFLLNPYNGLQNSLPSYLDTYHYIEEESDADAYLQRLEAFGNYYEQVLERMEESRLRKIVPPAHLLEATIVQMEKFIEMSPDKNMLYTSFQHKLENCDEINGKDDFLNQAIEKIDKYVYPVFFRMINYCRDLKKESNPEDGNWALPNGDNYYKYLLKHHTTLDLTPEEIHQIGLKHTERIREEIEAELVNISFDPELNGLHQTLKELSQEDRFILGNSIEGRMKCLAKYDSLIQSANNVLTLYFDEFPKSKLEVKRVPEFKQEGSSNAYYEVPTLDGNGSGSFYVRLDNLDNSPVYDMPTLAYHEGVPGHHYQLALHLEKESIPIYRKRFYNNAYIEGWALYAERLMFEKGAYENDPYGNIGRLLAEWNRAARLVTDTGIHFIKWNKGQAISYLEANSGLNHQDVVQEIDRYISDPGQACSYYIGYLKILELRQLAKAKLGSNFNLKQFHSIILSEGMVPMTILENLVNEYINNELEQAAKE